MKKLLAILLSALILMSVMSTAVLALELPDISEIAPEEGTTFYALVIDATIGKTGNCGLQLCALNVNDINHRGLCDATAKEDTELLDADGEITMQDISAGDIIALTYTGEVLESYPSTVLGVTRVYVVDHMGSLEEIVDLLPDGYEENGDYFPAWNDLFGPAVIDYTIGDGKVTLSWDKSDDESYTVYWKRSSSEEWKVAGTTTKHTVNITGLKNGVSYDFKVEILGEDSEVVTATPVEATYLYAISEVSVRSEPSYASDRWGSYSCGDKVEILGEVDGWYEVNYPYTETSKYVNADYLSEEVPDGTAEDEPVIDIMGCGLRTLTVTTDVEIMSDVRNAEVLGTLKAGETVEVTGIVVSDWLTLTGYQISYDDGVAYVDKDALSDPDFDTEADEIDSEDLPERTYSSYDDSGEVEICVVADSVTSTGATFKIRNSSEYMVDFGVDFSLQVYADGEWSNVEYIVDSYDYNLDAIIVWAGGYATTFTANWSNIYGELPSGHYRLIKEYSYETDDGYVNYYGICGFDIE